MQQTLVLDQAYRPAKVVSWQRALTMFFQNKVEIVESYNEDIRSVTFVIKMPAVVRLLRRIRGEKMGVKFSRVNIMTRDNFKCQYCGQKRSMASLTYDHVMPRSRGGKTTWTNVVTACKRCNQHKADRTPQEAGMKLLTAPVRPKSLPLAVFRWDSGSIPDVWASYVYWQGSLEDESGQA